MKWFYKILRISAWLLVIATLLTLFSGFFTTKYFLVPKVGYSLSYYIHTTIIPLFFIPLFYLHSLAGLIVLIARYQTFNKKYFKIFVALFWTGIFVLFIVFYRAQNPMIQKTTTQLPARNPNNSVNITLSLNEISRHRLASDCWLIINNQVYNITSYLSVHPGGTWHHSSLLWKGWDARFYD